VAFEHGHQSGVGEDFFQEKTMDYEQAVEKIRIENSPILDEFKAWLENSGVKPKTIKNHLDNIQFFAEYLVYYEPLHKIDEADASDIYSFLVDWFPRKAMWASESNTKSYLASFRKFFKFLHESQRIDQEKKDEVYLTLKEDRDEFLDAVACDDEDF
jgi:site-specific recombinase XerD